MSYRSLLRKLGLIWGFYLSATAIVIKIYYETQKPTHALIMLVPLVINLAVTVLLIHNHIHDKKKIETLIRAAVGNNGADGPVEYP